MGKSVFFYSLVVYNECRNSKISKTKQYHILNDFKKEFIQVYLATLVNYEATAFVSSKLL